MNVAGYIRVSTEQQKAEGSHENQRERLEEWADRNDHEITFYEDIAISGQADEREQYDRMLEEAEQYDAIVVRELSRWGRNLQRMLNDIRDLKERGVDFISLKDDIDMTTAQGKLMMQIIGAFNEFWANIARERANEMVQRRREQGKPIGRPKKLDDDQLQEVRDWREKGLSYGAIATLVEDAYGIDVDQSTIYRYCTETEEAA
jgi:DNA invertase Pin-like site-specific DNA recombinase